MMFVHPEINWLFDTQQPCVNTLVIENQSFFLKLLTDISEQISGSEGKGVLSEKDTPIPFSKNAEMLDRFVPFELNQKSLLTKIAASLEKTALRADYYENTMQLLSTCENQLMQWAFERSCDIVFPKLSVSALIKAAAPELRDEYESLAEKILDYMELVHEYDRRKMFFTVNLRAYLTQEEAELFMKTIIAHQFHVIMLESHAYPRCDIEKRLTIDIDLCEIA